MGVRNRMVGSCWALGVSGLMRISWTRLMAKRRMYQPAALGISCAWLLADYLSLSLTPRGWLCARNYSLIRHVGVFGRFHTYIHANSKINPQPKPLCAPLVNNSLSSAAGGSVYAKQLVFNWRKWGSHNLHQTAALAHQLTLSSSRTVAARTKEPFVRDNAKKCMCPGLRAWECRPSTCTEIRDASTTTI